MLDTRSKLLLATAVAAVIALGRCDGGLLGDDDR